MAENTQLKHTPIVFQGKASEYFGIWIVNLLLSLVTFGIYSAWAKVRRKKYFYNNTLIDNVGFDYHAKPISILKGRIVAFVLFALYVYGKGSSPILAGVLFLLFFLALPWLIVRGSIFNARNTSHRGLRFDFVGTTGNAAKVFIGLPLLTFLTLGLIVPYAAHEKNQFLMNNHRFGLSQFDMSRVVKGFYKVYAIVFIVPLILVIIGVIVGGVMRGQELIKAKAAAQHAQLNIPNVQVFAPINTHVLLAANDVTTEMPAIESIIEETPAIDAMPNAAEQESEQIADEVYKAEEVAPELTAEEEKAVIEAMKQAEAQVEKDKMKEWFKSPIGILAILGGALLYGLLVFGFAGYIQARIGNLVWNNTKLDKLSFKSSLRARDFMWLYLTNLLAIMLTFGLATPWAQIRMAKYRASKLQIVGDVDFDQFVGDKKEEVKATGEEIAEMFDVDLSFG
ncbi:MAG: YjgN family protein [Methylotenera sp.]